MEMAKVRPKATRKKRRAAAQEAYFLVLLAVLQQAPLVELFFTTLSMEATATAATTKNPITHHMLPLPLPKLQLRL